MRRHDHLIDIALIDLYAYHFLIGSIAGYRRRRERKTGDRTVAYSGRACHLKGFNCELLSKRESENYVFVVTLFDEFTLTFVHIRRDVLHN